MGLFNFRSFLMCLLLLSEVIVKCQVDEDEATTEKGEENEKGKENNRNNTMLGVYEFGNPVIFVTTEEQNFHPYRRIDNFQITFIENEYIYFKSNPQNGSQIKMIMYDPEDPDPVLQNLGKEMYWLYVNSSGVLPSMTVINTTIKTTSTFFTASNDTIQYHNVLSTSFYATEPVPPIDVFFEIPAETRSFKSRKTLIDYNSWGFFKWKWSKQDPVNFNGVTRRYCTFFKPNNYLAFPNFNFDQFNYVSNPCIPDLFLIYVHLLPKPLANLTSPCRALYPSKKIPGATKHIYITVPAFNVDYIETRLHNLTSILCQEKDNATETDCGLVSQLVLTNDHLVALSKNGIFVSGSMNSTSSQDTEKKLIHFNKTNPCAAFANETGNTCNFSDAEAKLHYTPVCYLLQIPNYLDMLIVSLKFEDNNNRCNLSFTVLFSPKPYSQWLPLFVGASTFNGVCIKHIVGIFYNHQLEHFDLSVTLQFEQSNKTEYVKRFVLPKPTNVTDKLQGYPKHLTSEMSTKGFADFTFPVNFAMTEVAVNPTTLDVLFMGDELWIAESAGPLVYQSVGSFPNYPNFDDIGTLSFDKDFIKTCRFNHPDRFFVCTNEGKTVMFIGRTAYQYSVVRIDRTEIDEINNAFGPNGLDWPYAHLRAFREQPIYVPAFSDNVLNWYIEDLAAKAGSYRRIRAVCNVTFSKTKMITFAEFEKHPNATGGGRNDLKYGVNQTKNALDFELRKKSDYNWCKKEWMRLRAGEISNTNFFISAPSFKTLALNPHKFPVKREQSHGPLTPFLIDSTHAILYEAELPDKAEEYLYFGVVNIGEKIQCPTATKGVVNCELYVRHIKRVAKFLPGFRLALYVSIIKPIPMKAIPTTILIHIDKNSNAANVTLINEASGPGKRFAEKDIGQTIYIPGHFSILLKGFPNKTKTATMWGFSTVIETKQRKIEIEPFKAWLIDFSTCKYRQRRLEADVLERNKRLEEENAMIRALNREYRRLHKVKREFNEYREKFRLYKPFDEESLNYPLLLELHELEPTKTPSTTTATSSGTDTTTTPTTTTTTTTTPTTTTTTTTTPTTTTSTTTTPTTTTTTPTTTTSTTTTPTTTTTTTATPATTPPGTTTTPSSTTSVTPPKPVECERLEEDQRPWISGDGGCHHILTLEDNPVLKTHGGRISLDRLDSISFVVKIHATTQIGSLMLYRPMIIVTNSNPDILIVDKIFSREQHFQMMKINMRPKGVKMGVGTLVIRSVVASIECETPSSMTFTVAVHRAEGRRLFAEYPIPICNNAEIFHRPWHKDAPNCITFQEITDQSKQTIIRNKQVVFTTLPVNYRPPSFRGAQVPVSMNIYNADPSAEAYNEWYQISKTSKKYDSAFCFGKKTRRECGCMDTDKVQEDPLYSDCKEKVYTVKRGKEARITITYDPVMRVEDQLEEFAAKKADLFVYIEEVNGRREFAVLDTYSSCGVSDEDCRNDLLDEINRNPVLNGGKKFVDAKSLRFVLYGTGLFHFKAGLGQFDTFEDVTGHFILYSEANDLNDVKLMVVMFLTLTVCFGLLFFGFLRVRRRLTAHLPQNTDESGKVKVE